MPSKPNQNGYQTIIIHIKGYWREQDKVEIPDVSGVFFVYESKFNLTDETVDILRLIFIGYGDHLNPVIHDEANQSIWKAHVREGHELCFAFADVEKGLRKRIQTAYIQRHKPPANVQTGEPFPFDNTTLVSTGKTAMIDPVITARKNMEVNHESGNDQINRQTIPVRAMSLCNRTRDEKRIAI